MSEISVLEAGITKTPLTKAPIPKSRVTFASLPRELRDKIYAEMVTVDNIIWKESARDFGCPDEWETMRAMFRASPALESFAIEAYETFFRINTFQMADWRFALLTRKAYYVRGHGWSDMMASVTKILIEQYLWVHQASSTHEISLLHRLRPLLACPRLRQVTVRLCYLVPIEHLGWDPTRHPEHLYRQLATTDKTLREITQVCRELIEKVGEGLKFESEYSHVEKMIMSWAQYMKVCRELREKTSWNLKSNITSPSEDLQHLCNIPRCQSSPQG